MVLSGLRSVRGFFPAIACAAFLAGGTAASAQEKVEASFRATLAGMPVGTGTAVLDIHRDRYSFSGHGKAGGLLRLFSSGSGEVSAQGTIQGTKLSPLRYSHSIRTRKKVQEVSMALAGNAVKQLAVQPPVEQRSDLVPLTEANKRGVLDPVSAAILPAVGANGLAPEACKLKTPVFDGRMRYDLTLAFKRHENVQIEGYRGPALVCSITFTPIGGHDKEKYAIKYLRETREMEMGFVPIAGTPFLTFYRIYLPTPLGAAVLEATRFSVTGSRTGARRAQTQ